MNLFSLSGKTALVAGASRGIGPKIAQQLAEAGAHAGMVEGAQDNPRLGAQDDIARAVGNAAEAPRVVKAKLAPVVERCADVGVLGDGSLRITDEQMPGHAQMHHQLVPRIEPEQQVL